MGEVMLHIVVPLMHDDAVDQQCAGMTTMCLYDRPVPRVVTVMNVVVPLMEGVTLLGIVHTPRLLPPV